MSILPPGQDGFAGIPPDGEPPLIGPHVGDQKQMYADLILAVPGLSDDDLPLYFKDSSIDPPDNPESVISPRAGLTISRDAFGMPHIVGETRYDVFFGTGYITGQDRLFLADVLRHVGRGKFSEFAGGALGLEATIEMDRTFYRVAGHSEAELEQQIIDAAAADPVHGAQVLADAEAFIDGINAYVAEARVDDTKRPFEYDVFNLPLENWKVADTAASGIAFLTVIGFGNGGGGEHQNSLLLKKLRGLHDRRTGRLLYRDLRNANHLGAPVTAERRFHFPRVRGVLSDAVATLDEDSFQPFRPIETTTIATGAALEVKGRKLFPSGMSNWLVVDGEKTASGNPIMVGGPQTGYFAPQALIEWAAKGGGVNVQGATPPGVPYITLGHTPDYAWTATAGGSDSVDVYVERICTPEGGETDGGTLFNGVCEPLVTRVDTWDVGDQRVTATVKRTVHGPLVGEATVDGERVYLARRRSSFGKEIQTAASYKQLNDNEATTAFRFRRAMSSNNSTLNWAYVNRNKAAFFHSGLYPRRARGVHPDFPAWGTGEWEWRGFLGFRRQPFARKPAKGFMTSWNNKPARGWRAADHQFAYSRIYRSLMLDTRLEVLANRGSVGVAEAVEAMADAATVDLRGQEVLPQLLEVLGADAEIQTVLDALTSWQSSGSNRIDRDGDGEYEHTAAIAIMDAWWKPLARALFDPFVGNGCVNNADCVYELIGTDIDNTPGPVGSAFQNGYYGYVSTMLREALGLEVKRTNRVLKCGDGTLESCAVLVRGTLVDTIAQLTTDFGSASLDDWRADPAEDNINFSLGGLAIQSPIAWQNRPTWQQVVQIQ